jgi:hypothetical protein
MSFALDQRDRYQRLVQGAANPADVLRVFVTEYLAYAGCQCPRCGLHRVDWALYHAEGLTV